MRRLLTVCGDNISRGHIPAPTRLFETAPNRKQAIISAGYPGCFCCLVYFWCSHDRFRSALPPTRKQSEIVVFAALSALIFLLFAALTFVLGRNLLKLFCERRLELGLEVSHPHVVGALLLSFVPGWLCLVPPMD